MPRTLLSAVTLLVLSVGVVDTAHAHDPKLLDVLSAIDIVPTGDQLRRVVRSPEAALDAVARDASLSLYQRERAISLLSAFPTRDVARRLETLASASSLNSRLQAMAVYTRVRGFAGTDPRGALAFATRSTRASNLEERESAIRGLRWIALPEADAALEKALAAETHAPLKATIEHVQRARAALRRAGDAR